MREDKRRVRDNATEGNIAAGTHYFELTKRSQGSLAAFHLRYGAALAATFTFETSLLDEVAVNSTSAGDWSPESSVTIDAAATTLAGKVYHVGNNGAVRARIVAVVGTGGPLDIAVAEKD
jgi:hypothetical protein